MLAGRSLLYPVHKYHSLEIHHVMYIYTFQLVEKWSRMRHIISLFANTDSSFLNNMQRLYSTLVGISPNSTTVVQIRHDKSRV